MISKVHEGREKDLPLMTMSQDIIHSRPGNISTAKSSGKNYFALFS